MAILVAGVRAYLSEKKEKGSYILVPFNGILIYGFIVGGTSYLPHFNEQTAKVVVDENPGVRANLVRPWNPDKNLVKSTKALADERIELTEQLTQTQKDLDAVTKTVSKTSTELTPAERTKVLTVLENRKASIKKTSSTLGTKAELYHRLGVVRVKEPDR